MEGDLLKVTAGAKEPKSRKRKKKQYRPDALGPVAEVVFNVILALFSLS